jgi:hypothetical protein
MPLRPTVDRSASASTRVGPVRVASVRYVDLATTIDERVGQSFPATGF